ncbi:GGDEF domain-containing protein [Trichocoleus sp. FACHB-262]|uniref:GGDEF domain-containing protein n=1 Tax=Trichocoleus sp. FACHB-262 TaxID=2692869 RepID=UPI00168914E2|nr:GGDEF domain-containing protein [Trichocoleus sp. FACHB-262]MBD2120060.1 GGDEF domain-containing protein [Trichocoleus sp. FACHB-262]
MDHPDHDPLTGLPTLKLMQEHFAHLVGEQDQFGMLLLDIDGFILFNDRYGHQAGDNKLRQLAHLICQVTPKDASVFRSGGDEFVVFLGRRQMAEVASIGMKVCGMVRQHFSFVPPAERSYCFPDRSYLKIQAAFTVSCGIAFYPAHGKNFVALHEAASTAMWQGGKRLHGGVLVVAEFKDDCC